jgi:CO/xanthine dehydrogenase Mo-binding subunit
VGTKVLERAAGHATGAYHVPCVDIEARTVYTNNLPSGAMRGFGVPQVTWALESCLDELCEIGGFDRWQLRYDNALAAGRMTATGQVLGQGVGVRQTLLALRDDYIAARAPGLACGLKNTGIGNGVTDMGEAVIEIASPSLVILRHGWTEMGQGIDTIAVQALCQETGLRPEVVDVRVRTDDENIGGMTTASRGSVILGSSIVAAARALRSDLAGHGLADLVGRTYRGRWACDWTTPPGRAGAQSTHFSYGYATQLVELGPEGGVARVVAAHDVGRVLNPTLFEGQVQGAVVMGLGYALSEDLRLRECRPVSDRLGDCGLLRAGDVPEIVVRAVEAPDPVGPYGAKGLGEIGLVPTAAAVANALRRREGERRFELPMRRRGTWRST